MLSRRTLLALPLAAAACKRQKDTFRGYAFIANQDGQAIAAVDLDAMAVARHIPLDAAPTQVLAVDVRPAVYALTPETGSVHEIRNDTLRFARKLTVGSRATSMQAAPDGKTLYVLSREPRALIAIQLDSLRVDWRISLTEDPVDLALTSDGKLAAISFASGLRLVNLASRQISSLLAEADFGGIAFLGDNKTLVAADRSNKQLSFYDGAVSSGKRLITHLPVAIRPDNFCFNKDGGQLFVTGEGMDGVVVVFPYYTPEVRETVPAGHAPGAMASSNELLFVTSPQSGDVNILNIETRKLVAIVQVGSDPGYVVVTPDDQFALVLNRQSGDVAVLSVDTIKANRYKSAGLLTVIPVGSRPVSAAVARAI